MAQHTPVTVAVHNGTFHTDDVFACATLSLVYGDEMTIIRTRDEERITQATIAVDVGGIYDQELLRFDHHQKGGAGVRDNGVPYASFGLVWRSFGQHIASSAEHAQYIDELLVQGIDARDNGYEGVGVAGGATSSEENTIHHYSIGEIISAFRPTWQEVDAAQAGVHDGVQKNSDDILYDAFMEAVTIAKRILLRIITQAQAYTAASAHIHSAYEQATDKRVITLEREYPGWQEVLQQYPEPLYIIYQREQGGWGAKAVAVSQESFATRKPFPESWAGLRDEALQQVTGVSEALFCHNGRFIVTARSKDAIVALVQKALIV